MKEKGLQGIIKLLKRKKALKLEKEIMSTGVFATSIVEEFRIENNTYVLDIVDYMFDLESSVLIENKCKELLKQTKVEKLILNLENISYMTTAGIGTLLSIYHICNQAKTEFEIANLSDFIKELLQSTHVLKVIKVML